MNTTFQLMNLKYEIELETLIMVKHKLINILTNNKESYKGLSELSNYLDIQIEVNKKLIKDYEKL